jgi:hypothetical protein
MAEKKSTPKKKAATPKEEVSSKATKPADPAPVRVKRRMPMARPYQKPIKRQRKV